VTPLLPSLAIATVSARYSTVYPLRNTAREVFCRKPRPSASVRSNSMSLRSPPSRWYSASSEGAGQVGRAPDSPDFL